MSYLFAKLSPTARIAQLRLPELHHWVFSVVYMYELRMLAKLVDANVGDEAERELDEGCKPRGPEHK